MRLLKGITLSCVCVGLFIATLTLAADAQTRRRKTAPKKAEVVAPQPTPTPVAEEPVITKTETKKNERPAVVSDGGNSGPARTPNPNGTTYSYEFKQPDFEISRIVIEHDETGRGTIKFTKRMFEETATDPIEVSPAALERINAAYTALNFIESTESYQYEKDFSHLGTMTFGLKKAGKGRTSVFNYTSNKDARALADEYRRLSNQFIWIFDITVARENQPLMSPRLLDSLDALMRRNEISDPAQMLPLLNSLSNDERIPLIARNHAKKLGEKVEKGKK